MQLGIQASLGATATSGVEHPAELVTNTKSIIFDGSNDYINLGVDFQSITEGGIRTICAWVKAASTDPTDEANRGRIFSMYRANDSTSFGIHAEGASAPANWNYMYRQTGDSFQSVDSGVNITTSWTHLALTQNGANLKFYINGEEEDSKTDATYVWSATRPAIIGGHLIASGQAQEFNGNIDEVGLWNSELSAIEVKVIYDNIRLDFTQNSVGYASSSNLQGWWRMGDNTATSDGTTLGFPFIMDSKTTTLGPELVVDGSSNWVGNFDVSGDVSSWTNQDDTKITLSHDSGTSGLKIEAESDGGNIYAYFTATVEVGEKYRVTADRVGGDSTTGAIRVGRSVGGVEYWNQYISHPVGDEEEGNVFTAAVNTTCIIVLKTNAHSKYIIFNNVSLKKITAGNVGTMTNMVSGDIESDVPS